MIQIIPSILTNNPNELQEKLTLCEGLVERVSIDIIDGKFADNKTIDPIILFDLDTSLKIDYQLMVYEPVNWIERCVRGQADRIIGHIEQMSDQVEFVGKVQEVGLSIGLALDIETSVAKIDPTILTNLDVVLVMSVKAGFGGQEFDKRAINKIRELDEIRARDDSPYRIQDDGGITLESIYNVHKIGVDEVSIGRKLFDGDLAKNLAKFQKAAHNIKQ
ncbi:MAG: Ribulose-phosphate 3-epimerase [Candidatus Woesebacteria bacterium GW2011_GWB1_39_12]|uniref:Ribulose-phosphate 3-epimerase n=2 Tax=Candidatus Woeseibacteriota TaxID=1752722 RepID=A0A0G0M1V6_9BACT|nr:MAG: Ribulose-phosphate 3-epimerase [Candidatus Woesebacteria bacterium GW2011_GWA1_39_12]KKR01366.1 MAG: Ribulose-phosphate 3-epimerase [Candidatus Woesebacteria bacterium GW2011_GWB1_39_12]